MRRDLVGFAFGVKLYFTEACLEKTNVPVRPYKRRKWQTEAQAERKAKKWIKRWGHEMQPCMFQTKDGYFAHPSMRAEIERAIAVQHIVKQYTDPHYGLRNGIIPAIMAAI